MFSLTSAKWRPCHLKPLLILDVWPFFLGRSPCCLLQVRIAEFIRGICNHKPRSPSHVQIVCSRYYVVPATEAGRKPGNKTTRAVLKVNQNPACLWLQVRSDESFCCGACRHSYVATTRSRLRVTCTRALSLICCLTESTCSSNYWNCLVWIAEHMRFEAWKLHQKRSLSV